MTEFYAEIASWRCLGACSGLYVYSDEYNGKPRYEFVDSYLTNEGEQRSYTCKFYWWPGPGRNNGYPNGGWVFDGPACEDINVLGTHYPGVPLNNWPEEVQQITLSSISF